MYYFLVFELCQEQKSKLLTSCTKCSAITALHFSKQYIIAHLCIRLYTISMAKKRDYTQLKQLGEQLFQQGYQQVQIADKLGVSKTTVNNWAIKGNWQKKKDNIILSKDTRLSELYEELKEFSRMIQEKEDFKVASSKEADARRKLIKDIKDLETSYNIAETIQIGRDFTTYLKDLDFDFAMLVLESYEGFVNHIIEKQKWQS